MSSAQSLLRTTVEADRQRIQSGQRPVYHALWTTSIDGSVDVTVRELPLIHLFVPDEASVVVAARLLVARTLDVDPMSFDVQDGGPAARG